MLNAEWSLLGAGIGAVCCANAECGAGGAVAPMLNAECGMRNEAFSLCGAGGAVCCANAECGAGEGAVALMLNAEC